MKKFKNVLVLGLFVLGLGMTSCSSDDDNYTPETPRPENPIEPVPENPIEYPPVVAPA